MKGTVNGGSMAALKLVFVFFVIIQGFHCLSSGNVTPESQLIFQ